MMKTLFSYIKASLLTFVVGTFALAMYPAESRAAEEGIRCSDEGHACHIVIDGTLLHFGKFEEF